MAPLSRRMLLAGMLMAPAAAYAQAASDAPRPLRQRANIKFGMPGMLTVPSPPAAETAAASFGVRNGPRPSCTMGCSIPTRRV